MLVGYGRVGRHIAQALHERSIPFVVAEENRQAVERLRAEGQAAVLGNAVEPATLIQAHIADARMLVIATPQTVEIRRMVEAARILNPKIEVVVPSHNEQEAALLEREHAGKVFVGESKLAIHDRTRDCLHRASGRYASLRCDDRQASAGANS